MPKIAKRKKQESSDEERKDDASSSDSGPEDRNPPKKGNAGKKVTAATKTGEEEITWEMDKSKSVKLRKFKGQTYIDIREYYEKDGKQLPGKKGISLTPSLWKKLTELMPEVDKALEEF